MSKLRILNLHEITEEIIKKDFSDYVIITFDDGLYSQYFYYKEFLKYNIPLYFFISTDIVYDDNDNQILDITCTEAHKLYFENNNKNAYMTECQIKEIYESTNCFIGGHSHTHRRLSKLKLREQTYEIKKECINMSQTFKKLDIIINSFAYPYNDELFQNKSYLKNGCDGMFNTSIKLFFGKERETYES